ncbi:IS1096 element passenger TnpR family protein [Chishuiella changwenlii]|uniref:IS1096 element passenger TnpR family protein n=1 Tax=Chishuiella changwenlii TaxID=1434701 RepID=UPI002FD90E1C
MIYKIRVFLDAKEDVFRDIEIKERQTLFTLYKGIISAFSLQGEELASFYSLDEKENQGKEIPLEDMSDDGTDETMADFYIKEAFAQVGDRMMFVYDFFEMWTFVAELIAIEDKPAVLNYPLTVYRFGSMPLKAPKKDIVVDLDEDDDMDFDNDSDLNDLQIDDDMDVEDL